MFVILTYDVGNKRGVKVMKTVKKYLYPVQRSVYEGFLTEKQIRHMKAELRECVDLEDDSVMLYKLTSEKLLEREKLGQTGYGEVDIL